MTNIVKYINIDEKEYYFKYLNDDGTFNLDKMKNVLGYRDYPSIFSLKITMNNDKIIFTELLLKRQENKKKFVTFSSGKRNTKFYEIGYYSAFHIKNLSYHLFDRNFIIIETDIYDDKSIVFSINDIVNINPSIKDIVDYSFPEEESKKNL